MSNNLILLIFSVVVTFSLNYNTLFSYAAYLGDENISLPKDVIPEEYKIYIFPQLNRRSEFTGTVMISLLCVNDTDEIILDSKGLNSTEVMLHSAADNSSSIGVSWMESVKNDQLVIRTNNTLLSNQKYTLKIIFKGNMRKDAMEGLFIKYYDDNCQKRYFFAAFLAPNHARSVFPCFDEPQLRAKFELTIAHPNNLRAISTTPIKETSPQNIPPYYGETKFNYTTHMSTYQLMFAVGEFHSVSSKIDESGEKIRIWSVKRDNCFGVALSTAKKVLPYFKSYFGSDHLYSYYDMFAFPNFTYVGFGGWGLSFVDHAYLSRNYANDNTRTIAKIVSHQIAQIWFGGLVNIKRWDDMWLLRGMALYLQMIGMEVSNDAWKKDVFVCSTAEAALVADSKLESMPLSEKSPLPYRLTKWGNSVRYDKGASIIYMLKKALGEKVFRGGLRTFIEYNEECTADANALWLAFQLEQPAFNVTTVMQSWTNQKGYPLINIKHVATNANGDRTYTATQSRFISDLKPTDPKYKNETEGFVWHVPLWYTDSSNPYKSKLVWLNATSVNFTVGSCARWFKANADQAGLYRVNYDPYNWESLIGQLDTFHKIIPDSDRYGLLSDGFSLYKADIVNITVPLKLTAYIANERRYCPFKIAVDNLQEISDRIGFRQSLNKTFEVYIRSLFKNALKTKWDDLGYKRDLYGKAFTILANHNDTNAVDLSSNYLREWMNTGFNPVEEYMREVVYTTAIKHGTDKEWSFLWEKYQNKSTDPGQKGILVKALANAPTKQRRKWLLDSLIGEFKSISLIGESKNVFIGESKIRKEDITTVLRELSKYPERDEVWDFFVKEFSKLVQRVGNNAGILNFTRDYDQDAQLQKVENFAKKNNLKSTQTFDIIRSNVKWIDKNYKLIDEFLKEREMSTFSRKNKDDDDNKDNDAIALKY